MTSVHHGLILNPAFTPNFFGSDLLTGIQATRFTV